MTERLKTTLDQWMNLVAISEEGSVQAAAARLHKSHTTLLYSVRKLESQLGTELVEVIGKKTRLTASATMLLRKAGTMIETARQLESLSSLLSEGYESSITVSVDHLCNRMWVYDPLTQFCAENPLTSVKLRETSLSSTRRYVKEKISDIAIINLPVENFPSSFFGHVKMLPVISSRHELAGQKEISQNELVNTTQIVLRDLGNEDNRHGENVGWLKPQRRITVDSFDYAIDAVSAGLGFCRLPEHMIQRLNNPDIITLSLQEGFDYQVPLHITLPKGENTGPAARELFALLIQYAAIRKGQSS
ncbi:LysR family transcriptional regulator [Serratia sp. P2ACOL2]|jgi:DNA-binding transcriptional LysR family regulator|uniref:LysR family transcriptional regulator n=1 Tax=Serratia sp. P2ACOL2 TaxID=2482769 RepID=UPI000EFC3B96|nr:LysR family transcriptional regulator [Serratia sp. P2ACOL2]AYO37638.1 LysR family transcriptional regulator [Serratia sp. P2ACOL2]